MKLSGKNILVAGAGIAGIACAVAAAEAGAHVRVTAQRANDPEGRLAAAGIGVEDLPAPPPGTDLLVVSPGFRPEHPLLTAAAAAGIEVIGEIEFAWRLGSGTPWLALTGTNGKTTTVGMLAAILAAAGRRTVATGNVGFPLIDAVRADPPFDVLAVELSSAQLHTSPTVRPYAAAILNLAPDHLDWHGSMEAYVAAKRRIFAPGTISLTNADDPRCADLGARFTFTRGEPQPGQLGVIGGVLVDRAFGDGVELAQVGQIRPPGPHNVSNALAAAGLARAYGVPAEAVAGGLRAFVPADHRNAFVGTVDGVAFVNDSKATNPHAALGSLTTYDPVVWIAGGQLKGASVDELVVAVRDRLRGVVVLGQDRQQVIDAIARHAPDIPVVEVSSGDDTAMAQVIRGAIGLARPGDTVLLAPSGASWDMFANYAARGEAFVAAVRALEGE